MVFRTSFLSSKKEFLPPVVISIGFITTIFLVLGLPPILPILSVDKIFYIATLGILVGIIIDFLGIRKWWRLGFFIIFLTLATYWITEPEGGFSNPWHILGLAILWNVNILTLWKLEKSTTLVPSPIVKIFLVSLGLGLVAHISEANDQRDLSFAIAATLLGYFASNFGNVNQRWNAVLLIGIQSSILCITASLAFYSTASLPALAVLFLIYFSEEPINVQDKNHGKLSSLIKSAKAIAIRTIPILAALGLAFLGVRIDSF
jgi:hypothetical protein